MNNEERTETLKFVDLSIEMYAKKQNKKKATTSIGACNMPNAQSTCSMPFVVMCDALGSRIRIHIQKVHCRVNIFDSKNQFNKNIL